MLLGGIVLGLVLGLLLGGRLENLANVRLRFGGFVLVALLLRFGTELAIRQGLDELTPLRLPLYGAAFALVVIGLWQNREQPGLLAAAAGAASNGAVVLINGGAMPVWEPSLAASGLTVADLSPAFHVLLPAPIGTEFLLAAGPFADVIPIPLPVVRNVASVGDVFLAGGLAWFVFATLLRGTPALTDRAQPMASSSLAAAAAARPTLLGGSAPGFSGSAAATATEEVARRSLRGRLRRPVVGPALRRVARHPYVRLAADARFSAFWLGQTISLFGDRLHQVALGVLVYTSTGSPLLTGLVFFASALPNLLLGPIAGTFVDRWDHKRVLVVSDLLRAGLVLLLPVAVGIDVLLIYPLVFLVTTVSLFFRPAKTAVISRLVDKEQLTAAFSATWTGETLADIAGYPLAGVFIAFLGSNIALAFWVDSATYVVSALLIVGLVIPPVVREVAGTAMDAGRAAAAGLRGAGAAFLDELRDGWRFLRSERALFHNTLVSVLAQLGTGATLAVTVVYARDVLDPALIPFPQNYAALEAVIGVGNLAGGIAVGAIGTRLRKGRLIVSGLLGMGIGTVLLGLTDHVLVALAAAAALGVANLVFVIPTQTLFGERVPDGLMGRVVAIRSSMVFGSMTLAMGVAGLLAEQVGAAAVIVGFGMLTVLAAAAAALLPSVRDV